jgi:hypothetical protein
VTLPEKIEDMLKLEAEATKPPWRVDQRKVKGPAGRTCADMRYANGDADAQFIAAARNIIRPLAQGYTAALTALEASDRDRQKLAARLVALRPHLATVLEHAERCRLGPQEIAALKAAMAD